MGNPGQACPHVAQEGLFRGFRCLVGMQESSRGIAGLLREFPEEVESWFSLLRTRSGPGRSRRVAVEVVRRSRFHVLVGVVECCGVQPVWSKTLA